VHGHPRRITEISLRAVVLWVVQLVLQGWLGRCFGATSPNVAQRRSGGWLNVARDFYAATLSDPFTSALALALGATLAVIGPAFWEGRGKPDRATISGVRSSWRSLPSPLPLRRRMCEPRRGGHRMDRVADVLWRGPRLPHGMAVFKWIEAWYNPRRRQRRSAASAPSTMNVCTPQPEMRRDHSEPDPSGRPG